MGWNFSGNLCFHFHPTPPSEYASPVQPRASSRLHRRSVFDTFVGNMRKRRSTATNWVVNHVKHKFAKVDIGAHGRNRLSTGGAQYEKGDIEINGKFYGCKRRKVVPRWVLPEKQESGVVFRADRMNPYIAIPLEQYLLLISLLSDKFEN